MRRIILSTIVVLATLGGLILVWQFRLAIVLFVLSLVVAAVVRPATDYWMRRGLSRVASLVLTYVIFLGIFLVFILLVGPLALQELTRGTDNFAGYYEEIVRTWPQGTAFQQAVAARLPAPDALYQALAGEQGVRALQALFGVAQNFFGVVSQLVIVLVLSVYWSADQVRFERLWLSALPGAGRARARTIWRSIELGVGAYIRSELIQSFLAAFLLVCGYWLIGLPYPVLLALSGALLWLMPWVGAVLAIVLPLLLGLNSGPLAAGMAAIYTLAVLIFLEIAVEPRLFNRRRYSSLLVILFIIALADFFGVIGLIIAPPLAAATQILLTHLTRTTGVTEDQNPRAQVLLLQARLDRLQQEILLSGEPPAPDVVSLIDRLQELIDEATTYLENNQDIASLDLPVASNFFK